MKISQVAFMEWQAIVKCVLMVCIILGIPMLFCGSCIGGTWTMLQNYNEQRHQQYQAQQPVASAGPAITAVNPSVQATAVAPSPYTINVAVDALKPSKQYPVPFTRDPSKDPDGTYFNMALDLGYGPYPAVYITPDIWQKAGGRIVIGQAPNIVYYTVYTPKGTSSSLEYDRQHNIVYTVEENPEIMQ